MKKKICGLCLALAVIAFIPMRAYANTSSGRGDWNVTFTSDKKMDCNFTTEDLNDVISRMQPGDTAVLTVHLKNSNPADTDWYMSNKVLQSMEESSPNSSAKGGAYTYTLIYTGNETDEKTLFDSDTVGGDIISQAGEGLYEAANALEEYFYLDTLSNGQTGEISLKITLDGETLGNDYLSTLADLQMSFAVEPNPNGTPATQEHKVNRVTSDVKTGDNFDLTPFIGITCISGLLFLLLALYGALDRKKQRRRAK